MNKSKYVTTGIHARYENGATQIFYPGTEIVPTDFELVSFPNKFQLVEAVAENKAEPAAVENVVKVEVEDEVEEVSETSEEVEADSLMESMPLDLDELKSLLEPVINSGEYEDSVVEEAKGFLRRNPTKPSTQEALANEIRAFLSELEEEDEVE